CRDRCPAAPGRGSRAEISAHPTLRSHQSRSHGAGSAERSARILEASALSPQGQIGIGVRFVKRVDIFTDGACSGNPGPGGWGAILRSGTHEKEISGGDIATTNNRMELLAVINGLNALKTQSDVTVHTDSRYVMDGATQWLKRWKANGWKTSDKKPVRNDDLWHALDSAMSAHKVQWRWIRGHSDHLENERADALARAAIPRS